MGEGGVRGKTVMLRTDYDEEVTKLSDAIGLKP